VSLGAAPESGQAWDGFSRPPANRSCEEEIWVSASTEATSTQECLEQVPQWEWYLEVGYTNGQMIRVPTPNEAETKALLGTFTEAVKTGGWVRIDGTTAICAADLRYLQVSHRAMPCRVEPIGFATEPSGS
jgi:hypothetical protein